MERSERMSLRWRRLLLRPDFVCRAKTVHADPGPGAEASAAATKVRSGLSTPGECRVSGSAASTAAHGRGKRSPCMQDNAAAAPGDARMMHGGGVR